MVHASVMASSNSMSNCESWIAFIYGATLRYIHRHLIAAYLVPKHHMVSSTCLSVCDTESSFHGIDKHGLVGMTKHA